jgi:formate-dependent nitrite reductase cytochrome c552 subunit
MQPYRLENSLCWLSFDSGDRRLTCTACHNPHEPVVRDSIAYDKKCLSCHLSATGSQPTPDHPGVACKVETTDCVSCHMPKLESPGMYTKFTDHQIRIVHEGEPYPN